MSLGLFGGIPSLGGAAASVGSASPIGWASMGLNALGGLGSMFGKSRMSAQTSSATATSGIYGAYTTNKSADYKKPMIDFSEPAQVAALAVIVFGAILIYKKVK